MTTKQCNDCKFYKGWCDCCVSAGFYGNNDRLASDFIHSEDDVCKYKITGVSKREPYPNNNPWAT